MDKISRLGFTLIEIMVAVAIGALIVGIGGAKYMDFNKTQSVKAAGQTFKNNLRAIQGKATSSIKPAGCGSNTLDGYRVIMPNFTTYTSEADCSGGVFTDLVTYTLPANISFNTLPGGFTFNVLGMGTTLGLGVVYTLKDNSTTVKYYSICVVPSGDIKDCGYAAGSLPICTCLY